MSRFDHYDTDEERLPEGMTRVGYDADTQTYTFRDADGSYWEGPSGSMYGRLTRVSDGPQTAGDAENAPFIRDGGGNSGPGSGSSTLEPWEEEKQSWRQAWAPLLNFFVLVGLFLAGVVWLLYWGRGSSPKTEKEFQLDECGEEALGYEIAKGDTCLAIARNLKIDISELLDENEGLDCDNLRIGGFLCLPPSAGN